MTEFELKVLKLNIRELVAFDDKYIFSNGTLLDLSHQGLNDEQGIEIAEALLWNPLITKVILSHNNLHREGAIAFTNSALTSHLIVELDGNPVTNESSEEIASLKKVYADNDKILILEQPVVSDINETDEVRKNSTLIDNQNAIIATLLKDINFEIDNKINTIVNSKLWDSINAENLITLMSKLAAYYQILQRRMATYNDLLKSYENKNRLNKSVQGLISTYLDRVNLMTDQETIMKFSDKIKEHLFLFTPPQIIKIIHVIAVLGIKDKNLMEVLEQVFLDNLNQFSLNGLRSIKSDYMHLQARNEKMLIPLNKQLIFQLKYSTEDEQTKECFDISTTSSCYYSIENLRRDCAEMTISLEILNKRLLDDYNNRHQVGIHSVDEDISKEIIFPKKRLLHQFQSQCRSQTPIPTSNTENSNFFQKISKNSKIRRSLTPTP